MSKTAEIHLDYELLDFGEGRKLERFGGVVLDRPEIAASDPKQLDAPLWKSMPRSAFKEAPGQAGKWSPAKGIPEGWKCRLDTPAGPLDVQLKPGRFKHVGVFPEQEKNWQFLEKTLKPGQRFLNLFAYTGVSSMVASAAGADVFHVDASKSVVNWAAQNARLNGINGIHWVCEDALKFAAREVRRGNQYHGIMMDPPVYGKGKSGEHWKLEHKLPELVDLAAALLMPGGFLIINTYSPVISVDDMSQICIKSGLQCTEKGWLAVCTSDGRKLPLSKYVLGRAPY